jgi:hypothetical protein
MFLRTDGSNETHAAPQPRGGILHLISFNRSQRNGAKLVYSMTGKSSSSTYLQYYWNLEADHHSHPLLSYF